jgi:UDP-N-acetylglucosamine/UDP-N-acetylgalactosamine diphosphorylase
MRILLIMSQWQRRLMDRAELDVHLAACGQAHLLRFWDGLTESGRERLAAQIAGVDFALVDALYRQAGASQDWAAIARQASPPRAVRLGELASGMAIHVGGVQFSADDARRRGAEELAAGRVGVLVVAGGQGSRLGFDHPKGLYPIGPVSGASLLAIHLQKAQAVARRHGAAVPVYLMSSTATHDELVAYLAENDRFGLPEDDVIVFKQGTMPAVDRATGQLLLAAPDSLFLSPDGHGGMVAALASSGALEHMRRRGIEHLFYLQVDNPLVPICDAAMVGAHLLARSELTSIAVSKQTPHDKVGNFIDVDGHIHVIEYSDLPDDVAERRGPDGQLVFWAGSIAVHVFSVRFLEQVLTAGNAMPFHIVQKKVPFIDGAGERVEPQQPNALKFERFIFDLLPKAENALVVEYAEREVFAPLKNAPGEERDTPQYVRRMMIELHAEWLRAAGTRVAEGVAVEISPLWALDAEGVAARADRPREISAATFLSD